MEEIDRAVDLALSLVTAGDPELLAVIGLSLRVSLTAATAAFCIGIPLAAALATTRRLPGRSALLVLANALSRRLRTLHRRGGCHSHRWRQHTWLHPHHDHRHRAGNL